MSAEPELTDLEEEEAQLITRLLRHFSPEDQRTLLSCFSQEGGEPLTYQDHLRIMRALQIPYPPDCGYRYYEAAFAVSEEIDEVPPKSVRLTFLRALFDWLGV